MDLDLISRCADPTLKSSLVEKFIAAAGSNDPLAITVTSDGRLILLPKAANANEAVALIRPYIGQAVVRVGLTQLPAGMPADESEDLDPSFFDSCRNLKLGTRLMAKIVRIVARWYGNPTSTEAAGLIFEDSVEAWKTGYFEGVKVFTAPDPNPHSQAQAEMANEPRKEEPSPLSDNGDICRAEMRVDLSRIGMKE